MNVLCVNSVKLSEAHLDINIYKHLDDTIMEMILLSDNSNLKIAQDLIKRIKTRKLYKIIAITDDNKLQVILRVILIKHL